LLAEEEEEATVEAHSRGVLELRLAVTPL